MKIKKIAFVLILALSISVVAAGGSGGTVKSSSGAEVSTKVIKKSLSYEKAQKLFGGKTMLLSFLENTTGSLNNETQYYTVGYYKKRRDYNDNVVTVERTASNHSARVKEVVDNKTDKAYVIKSKRTYYVHRPPYRTYNQHEVSGKVTKMGEIK